MLTHAKFTNLRVLTFGRRMFGTNLQQFAYVCNILEDVCIAICKQMYVWDKYYCCVAILKHVSMASTACHAYEIIRNVRYG